MSSTVSLRRKLNQGILQPTPFINRYSGGSREVVQGRVHAVPLCCSIYRTFEKGENLQRHHYKTTLSCIIYYWHEAFKQAQIIVLIVNAWIIEYKCPSLTFNKEVQTRSVWFMTAGQRSLPSQLETAGKKSRGCILAQAQILYGSQTHTCISHTSTMF